MSGAGEAAPALEIVRATPALAESLAEFFERLRDAGVHERFHPHPFDRATAAAVAAHPGLDLHYALLEGRRVLGYGLLRGWDEGYAAPSLGIAIRPEAQGRGLGRLLMHFLHAAARARGAQRVRLRVHPDNGPARALYEGLGYRFEGEDRGQLVGWLDL